MLTHRNTVKLTSILFDDMTDKSRHSATNFSKKNDFLMSA